MRKCAFCMLFIREKIAFVQKFYFRHIKKSEIIKSGKNGGRAPPLSKKTDDRSLCHNDKSKPSKFGGFCHYQKYALSYNKIYLVFSSFNFMTIVTKIIGGRSVLENEVGKCRKTCFMSVIVIGRTRLPAGWAADLAEVHSPFQKKQ